jgi:F420-0:gamma-glutamyl ligase
MITLDEQIDNDCEQVKRLFKQITGVDVQVKTVNGEFIVTDPDGQEFKTGLVRKQ